VGVERRDVGIRLIVLYKAVKAVAEVLLAAALVALAASGELAALRDLARHLREHVASRWSLLAGRALATLLSQRGVRLLELGLLLDGILSGFEGWALWRGHRWGAWLVVVATATPLPLELRELARTHRASRAALVAVNVAVVAYLAFRLAASRARHRTSHDR